MVVKNLTSWIPQSGSGYVLTVGLLKFQDNLGNLVVDNLSNNIVTNPSQLIGKHATAWAASGV